MNAAQRTWWALTRRLPLCGHCVGTRCPCRRSTAFMNLAIVTADNPDAIARAIGRDLLARRPRHPLCGRCGRRHYQCKGAK